MSRKFAEPLIEHLRATGTGEAKLVAIAETADRCNSREEFMAAIQGQVPPGTLTKIEKWVEANPPPPAAKKADKPAAADKPAPQ